MAAEHVKERRAEKHMPRAGAPCELTADHAKAMRQMRASDRGGILLLQQAGPARRAEAALCTQRQGRHKCDCSAEYTHCQV
jgi:hypothetical protein